MFPFIKKLIGQEKFVSVQIAQPFRKMMAISIIGVILVLSSVVFLFQYKMKSDFVQMTEKNYATVVAIQISELIGELENLEFWEYDVDKLSITLTRFMRPIGLKAIYILNKDREVVAEKTIEHLKQEDKALLNESPILFNNGVVGYVQISIEPPGLKKLTLWISLFILLISVGAGIFFYFFPVFIISELEFIVHQSYQELEAANKELEQKVKERTVELRKTLEDLKKSHELILQSEKMAAIGQLAGGVAHEINNPLGVILGFAQSIAHRIKDGDPLAMPVQSIAREANRCKNLVQDLLTFSRVGNLEKELCDLAEVIQSALTLVEAQTKVKSVELIKDFGEDVGKIMINRNQIQQVIINLCNNAIDAMSKGGILTIQTEKVKKQGEEAVEIKIQDTGMGIPKEIQSKIFEPFFTTKETGKGTGLGLSLVYEIVQKHGGTIDVKSEVGKGTIFTVSIPFLKR